MPTPARAPLPAWSLRILLSNLLEPLLEVLVVFLLQRRIGGRAVNLARLVLALVELHPRPFVVNVDHVGIVDDLLHQRRRNEVDPLGVSKYEIAGHDRGLADAHRDVDAADDHVADGAGMRAPEV